MIKMLQAWKRKLFGSQERASKMAVLDQIVREHYRESAKVDRIADKIVKEHDDPLSALAANMRRAKWRQ